MVPITIATAILSIILVVSFNYPVVQAAIGRLGKLNEMVVVFSLLRLMV